MLVLGIPDDYPGGSILKGNRALPRGMFSLQSERLGFSMTREMHFNALGQKALPALGAAAGKDGAAIFCFHACTKTELLFACALGSLIGTFHKTGLQVKRDAESMNRNRVVNEGFGKLLGKFLQPFDGESNLQVSG